MHVPDKAETGNLQRCISDLYYQKHIVIYLIYLLGTVLKI